MSDTQDRIDRHLATQTSRENMVVLLRGISDDRYSGVLIDAEDSELCPPKPRRWWRLWIRQSPHDIEMIDYMMHADYYCHRCGLAWRGRHNLGY